MSSRALLGASGGGLLGSVSDHDLRLLRVFRAVVDCGGFAAAELELNISRSTISRHIKDLETRLGVTLCRRGRAGFALTAEGAEVQRSALRLLASVDAFHREVSDLHRAPAGSLAIALFDKTVSNPHCHIDRAIARFADRAPAVHLQVHVEPLNAIERGVIEGRYQVGVIPDHRPSSSLSYSPLFEEEMVLYCGPGHPLYREPADAITPERVRTHRYVGIGYHSPNMEISQQLGQERQATAYDQEAVAHLLLSGRYVGYLPDHYAAGLSGARALWPLCPETFRYTCRFSAITRSGRVSRVVEAFVEALRAAHNAGRRSRD
jgi:DNA-binding transcriptional LysR family regulator